MISGFIRFIFRTLILDPMACIGFGGGLFIMLTYPTENVHQLAASPYLYGVVFVIALLYALLFKHVYHSNSTKVNWMATLQSSFKHFLTILFAAVCAGIIVYAINYGFGHKLDNYVRNIKE